jgi:hypothetical protein
VLAARFNHNGQYCLTCGKDRTLRCVEQVHQSPVSRGLAVSDLAGDDPQAVEPVTRAVRQGGYCGP